MSLPSAVSSIWKKLSSGEMNLNNKQVIKANSFIQIASKKILLYARSRCHQYNPPTGKKHTHLFNELLTLLSQAPTAFYDKILTLYHALDHVLIYCFGVSALKAIKEKIICTEMIQTRKTDYSMKQVFSISDFNYSDTKSFQQCCSFLLPPLCTKIDRCSVKTRKW